MKRDKDDINNGLDSLVEVFSSSWKSCHESIIINSIMIVVDVVIVVVLVVIVVVVIILLLL